MANPLPSTNVVWMVRSANAHGHLSACYHKIELVPVLRNIHLPKRLLTSSAGPTIMHIRIGVNANSG